MSYSLVGADRNTHLKIAAVALVGSMLAGLAFHGSLLAEAVSKNRAAKTEFVDAGQISRAGRLPDSLQPISSLELHIPSGVFQL